MLLEKMHTRWHTYPPKEEQLEQSLTKKSLSDFISRRSVDPLYKLIKKATSTDENEKQWLATIQGYFDTYASAIMKITRPKMWKSEYELRNEYTIEYGEPSPSDMRIVMARLLTYEELYTESMKARMSLQNESFDYDFIWKPPKQQPAKKVPDSNGNYNYLQHSHWLSLNNPKDVYFVSKINCGFDPKNHWGLYMADLPGTDCVSFRMACCKERVGQSEGCWIRLDKKQQEGVVVPYRVMPKNYWSLLSIDDPSLKLATEFNNNVQKGTAFRDTDKYVQLDSKIITMWESVTIDLEAEFKAYITELDKIYESTPPGQLPLNPSASLKQELRQKLISVLELEQQYNEVQGYKPTHDWNSYMDLYLFKVSQIREHWTEEKRGGIMIDPTTRIPFLRATMTIAELDSYITKLGATTELGKMWKEYRDAKESLEGDENSYKLFKQSEYLPADYAGNVPTFMREYELFQKTLESDTIKVKDVMKKIKGNIQTTQADYTIVSTPALLSLLRQDDIDGTIENQQVRILKDELPKLKSTSKGDLDDTKYASVLNDITFIADVITKVNQFKTNKTPPSHQQLPPKFESSNLQLIEAYNQIYIDKERELANESQRFRNILVQLEQLASKYSPTVFDRVFADLNYLDQINDINTNIQKIQKDIDVQRQTTTKNFGTLKALYDNTLATFQDDIKKIDTAPTIDVTERLNDFKTIAISVGKFNTKASEKIQESIDKLTNIITNTDMTKDTTAYNTAWADLKKETPNLLQLIGSLAVDDTNLQTLLLSFKTITEGVHKIYSDNGLYKETDEELKARLERERVAELQRRRDLIGRGFDIWLAKTDFNFISDSVFGLKSLAKLFADYKLSNSDLSAFIRYGLVRNSNLTSRIIDYRTLTLLTSKDDVSEMTYIGETPITNIKALINEFLNAMINRDTTKFNQQIQNYPKYQLNNFAWIKKRVDANNILQQVKLGRQMLIPRGPKYWKNSCWMDTVFMALFGTPENQLTNAIWQSKGIEKEVLELTYTNNDKEVIDYCDDASAIEIHKSITTDIYNIQTPDANFAPQICLTATALLNSCNRNAYKRATDYGIPTALINTLKLYYPSISLTIETESQEIIYDNRGKEIGLKPFDTKTPPKLWDPALNSTYVVYDFDARVSSFLDIPWTTPIDTKIMPILTNYTLGSIIYAVQATDGADSTGHFMVHTRDFMTDEWYFFDKDEGNVAMRELIDSEFDTKFNMRTVYKRMVYPDTVETDGVRIISHLVFVDNAEVVRLMAMARKAPAPQAPGTTPSPQITLIPTAPAPQAPGTGPAAGPAPQVPTPAATTPQVITETLLQISDLDGENVDPVSDETYQKLYKKTFTAVTDPKQRELLQLARPDSDLVFLYNLRRVTDANKIMRYLLHTWWAARKGDRHGIALGMVALSTFDFNSMHLRGFKVDGIIINLTHEALGKALSRDVNLDSKLRSMGSVMSGELF